MLTLIEVKEIYFVYSWYLFDDSYDITDGLSLIDDKTEISRQDLVLDGLILSVGLEAISLMTKDIIHRLQK
jgi:hypothetical protein